MAVHTIVRCSCGVVLAPCACGELADSAFDPHHVDMRDGACEACLNGTRPIVKTTPLDPPLPSRFGAAHAHDLDNTVDLEPK